MKETKEIFIGSKSINTYVYATLNALRDFRTKKDVSGVVIRARGHQISKALSVLEILKKTEPVKAHIESYTDDMEIEGKLYPVTAVEIRFQK